MKTRIMSGIEVICLPGDDCNIAEDIYGPFETVDDAWAEAYDKATGVKKEDYEKIRIWVEVIPNDSSMEK